MKYLLIAMLALQSGSAFAYHNDYEGSADNMAAERTRAQADLENQRYEMQREMDRAKEENARELERMKQDTRTKLGD